MSWLLHPYVERRTWEALAYLLIGLPLGVLEFTFVVTGFSLGLGMIVTLVGIPVLVGTMLACRGIASFERGLAVSLLGAPMPHLGRKLGGGRGFFWTGLKELAAGRRTWEEVAYLLLRLPLGTLDFTVAVTLVSLALGGLAMPIVVAAGAPTSIGSWDIDTVVESLVFVPVSVVFLLVGPRLLLAWSAVPRRVATAMLGRVEKRDMKQAVRDILARLGEADGFAIMDDLEVRFGRGPFLTPTTVEATLLALESSGLVTSRSGGARMLYSLASISGVSP